MSLNSNAVQPPITPQLQDTGLPAALVPSVSAVANQSEPEHIEPVLLNHVLNNSSVQVVDEFNRPSTPIVEHSAPEKSPRSTNAFLLALPNTTDDSLGNLKQAALSGDKEAQFNLGEMYDKGEGVEVDKVKAFEWFQKAAVQGYSKAQFNVGVMYVNGEGVEENKEKAFEWFLRATEQGDPEAQYELGYMYSEGEGVAKNIVKAFEWFQKAAGQGHPSAQCQLAYMYDKGEGVEENKVKAFEWYQKAAEQGHPDAQFNVAIMYRDGVGVEISKEKAFEWFHKAANQGDITAQFDVAIMYNAGCGVEANKEKAFEWFHKAAGQGHPGAQFNVGVMYRDGVGVAKNLVKAFEWFQKAAGQGHPGAQNQLAYMYDSGEGVAKNLVKAFEWYQKAAEQGHPEAQFNVGVMYDEGEGVEVNKVKAFEWYQKAAEQGEYDAMKYLCDFYKDGQGVEKNLPLATYWLLKYYFESDGMANIDGKYNQLFEFIPSTLANFTEFGELSSISFAGCRFIANSVIEDSHFPNVANFIKIDSKIKVLKLSCKSKLSDYEANLLAEALKVNTQLTSLLFCDNQPSKKMADQIEVLLTQNRDIAELRQYVEDLKIQMTHGFPFDGVKNIVDKMIVADLKSGQTKEATKNAIDELLIIADIKELGEDTKIT